MVQGEAIEHLAHIEADFTCRVTDGFAYLFGHLIVVDVDFDEGCIFAIDKRQITIGAKVRATIRYWDQLIIGFAADVMA